MKNMIDMITFRETVIMFLSLNKNTILFALFAIIASDIFLLKSSSDVLRFSVLFGYFLACKFYSLKSVFTYTINALLLVIIFILYIFTSAGTMTEKTSVWFVLILLFGVIQHWSEIR